MNKFTVALAAMSLLTATTGTVLAGSPTDVLVFPTAGATTRADAPQEPRKAKTNNLDFTSTQSIVRMDRKASKPSAAAGRQSGIAVNPWIVPSFR